MHGKAGIWLKLGVFVASATAFSGHLAGQTKDSSQLPIIGDDGVSKDFKLRGPLGVFQLAREPVKVPRAIRTLLAPKAKVRLLHKLASRPEDTLLVYDTSGRPNPLIDIRFPVVLILRSGRVIDRVSLKPRGDDDPDWVFLEAGEIRLSSDLPGIVLAFRSMGDGSASLFLMISPDAERYRIVLRKIIGQGRLRTDQEGNLELWDANFGDECVWCDHYYSILSYRWDGSHVARVKRAVTCREISPDETTDNPIEAVAHSLEVENTNANKLKRQEPSKGQSAHPRDCDLRDPTRPVNKLTGKTK